MARASLRYQSHRDPQEALRMRLREVAAARVRFGYRRLTVWLRRDGWRVNAKRIYRLYTEEGLIVRTKLRRRAARRNRVPQAMATAPNQRWSGRSAWISQVRPRRSRKRRSLFTWG